MSNEKELRPPAEPALFQVGDLLYDEEYEMYTIIIEVYEENKEYYVVNFLNGIAQSVVEGYVDLHQAPVRKLA